MPLVVRNVQQELDEPEEALLEHVAARLKVPVSAIQRHALVRRSLDARKGRPIRFIYNVELALDGGIHAESRCVRRLFGRNVEMLRSAPIEQPEPGTVPLSQRPLIIGFGPAGMFAAIRLAEFGYEPIVLERGREVRTRHRDILHTFYREGRFNPESNLLYGEGGAGTYSDGKVYTRVSHPAVRSVLAILCRFGADRSILIDSKPHIGSDRLPTICTRIREHIEHLGGQVRFGARVTGFKLADTPPTSDGTCSNLVAVRVSDEWLPTGPVLLGIGHSARDTIAELSRCGVRIDAKPFQLGVRIEHPQEMVDRWQYGAAAGHPRLPPADYELVAKKAAGRCGDLFSFCMCPGGMILPTNESAGLIATNGASRSSRRGRFANSGLVITVDPAELGRDPLAGLAVQRQWEERAFAATGATYMVPAQRCSDFLADRPSQGLLETSYPLGGKWCRLADLIPAAVADAVATALPMLERKLPGFAGPDSILTAPETRASAPVRITRDPTTRQSLSTRNLYPIGEGAGYAGGIVSAAIDGIRTADVIIGTYRPVR